MSINSKRIMKSTILLAIILITFGCQNTIPPYVESSGHPEGFTSELNHFTIKPVTNSNLEGSYQSSQLAQSYGKVELLSDNTFIFTRSSCFLKENTTGNWKREKDEVVLTSHKKYKRADGKPYFYKDGIFNMADIYLDDWKLKIEQKSLVDESDVYNPVYQEI